MTSQIAPVALALCNLVMDNAPIHKPEKITEEIYYSLYFCLIPELQVTDIAQYKKVIESHVVKYGVKWVIGKTTRNDIMDQDLNGARGRPRADYLWRSLYECHRAGSKRHAMVV
ncbi:hypothetical protein CU097_014721 [Rhizopus azygosporus]|uniref:Uncharacterized protein n=1 Tax=Rhizopus azygosporus TaxID=86630 RepID=A0A367KAZ6_RHIAZ|nr:hypothetical protein CU097_014721 [Rhizopus azygosporus]